MDIRGILQTIPHRYPFLLIDRVVEIERKKKIVALKNVTINEPFFPGHFPGTPVMPGVLIIEAMAQAGALLVLNEVPDRQDKLVYFAGIDKARFRRAVVPGDQLRLILDVIHLRPTSARMKARAEVDGELAAEGEILSVMQDRQ